MVTPSDIRHANAEVFVDTLRGDATKPELAKVLCANTAAVDSSFDLDLSWLARLSGHSQPRTHCGKKLFRRMTITDGSHPDAREGRGAFQQGANRQRCTILTNSKTVAGCEYKKAGTSVKEFGPMILASGGFGADFAADTSRQQRSRRLVSSMGYM